MQVFISHSGGRPMKPISADAPEEVAELALALRELIEESLPPSVPTGVLASAAGIGKSTLFHALSGQRVPTLDTVMGVVKACTAVRRKPDLVTVTEDGSVVIAEVKNPRISAREREHWAALVEQARRPPFRVGPRDFSFIRDPARETEGDPQAHEEQGTSVAAALEGLERAMHDLEEATRGVARAKAVLAEATARQNAVVAKATEWGVDVEGLRVLFNDEAFQAFAAAYQLDQVGSVPAGADGEPAT